jgi:hypothetical protein
VPHRKSHQPVNEHARTLAAGSVTCCGSCAATTGIIVRRRPGVKGHADSHSTAPQSSQKNLRLQADIDKEASSVFAVKPRTTKRLTGRCCDLLRVLVRCAATKRMVWASICMDDAGTGRRLGVARS